MSGRFTFTAGNTLTAAQLNSNVMDGIPYKIVAGLTAAITGNAAITFPASFTTGVIPIVNATVNSNAGSRSSVTVASISNTGCTFYIWTGSSAATLSAGVFYTAIQMTSTTGGGNS